MRERCRYKRTYLYTYIVYIGILRALRFFAHENIFWSILRRCFYFSFSFLDRHDSPLPNYTPGPIAEAANCETVYEFWKVLFTDEIINIIVECTNVKIEDVCSIRMAAGQQMQSYHHLTDVKEVNALFAILYHSGMWKTHRVDAEKLWSYDNGVSFYRCVMPFKRFNFLTSCFRFDKKEERDAQDRLAPIRKIWDLFINNCKNNYNPSNMCTVDEQLHGFRGRCKHRVYMKSKPDKYGLMLKALNDALTSYMVYFIFLFYFLFMYYKYL